MKSYIAFHETRGIYLGVLAGCALFSATMSISSKAIRFDTEEMIQDFFKKTLPGGFSDEIKAIPVETKSTDNYVGVIDIIRSGHKKHTESLLDNLQTLSDTIH
jgi:hypothetical protein